MGFGADEEWEHEDQERAYSRDEEVAISIFEYDYDEWDSLSRAEQRQKIIMSKMMT